jgi:amidase
MLWEIKWDMEAYLRDYVDPSFPIRTLADIVAFNQEHAAQELPWFGQDLLERAMERTPLTDPAYIAAAERLQRWGRAEGIDAMLREHGIEAVVAPTNAPAAKIDLLNGDHWLGGSSTPAAIAGYPIVTVPAGGHAGMPLGLSFIGSAYAEATLIRFAYAFEQATHARRPPTYAAPGVVPPAPAAIAVPVMQGI